MKKCTSFLSLLTVLALIFSFFPTTVSASTYAKTPKNCNYYLIQHVGSGKYLDITDESKDNGARLQIWERFPNHQNQVFQLVTSGNAWKIVSHNSGKVIEVRNSDKNNGGLVAQWDDANIACQKWYIICNDDGTVSFKNCNSGKFLDVTNNGKTNGVKLIQYKANQTTAQKFKLYRLSTKDILNANWKRNLSSSEINWTKTNVKNLTVVNRTHEVIKNGYYPTPGYKYIVRVDYIDHDTVHDMVVKKSLNKTTKQKIKELIQGEVSEEIASYFIKETLGYEIPCLGIALGILDTLSLSDSANEWNKFAKTTKSGKGIKKTTYVSFKTSGTYSRNGAYWVYLDEVYSYSYELWDGNGNVNTPSGCSGEWNIMFK